MNATATTKSGIVYTGQVLRQDAFTIELALEGEATTVLLLLDRIETLETDEASDEATFEAIADLEWAAKQAKNDTLWAEDPMNNRGQHDQLVVNLRDARKATAKAAQGALFAALSALTPEQMARYGTWRAER